MTCSEAEQPPRRSIWIAGISATVSRPILLFEIPALKIGETGASIKARFNHDTDPPEPGCRSDFLYNQAGTVTGAVPAFFIRIPFKLTTKMRAADGNHIVVSGFIAVNADFFTVTFYNAAMPRRKCLHFGAAGSKDAAGKIPHGMKAILQQRFRRCSRRKALWRKGFLLRVFPFHNEIGYQHGGNHGAGHAPFLKTSRHVPMGCVLRKIPNIGDAVQRHTVLRGPVSNLTAVRPKLLRLFRGAAGIFRRSGFPLYGDLLRRTKAALPRCGETIR